MSKSPKKSKSPTKSGNSSKKNGSPRKNSSNGSNSNNKNNSSNGSNNGSSNGHNNSSGNLIYQARKIQLGLTHEMGTLDFRKGKLVWWAVNEESLKYDIIAQQIKSIEWLNVDKRRKMMKITFTDKTRPHLRLIGFSGEV